MARKALFEILQKKIVCFELSEDSYFRITNENIPQKLSTLKKNCKKYGYDIDDQKAMEIKIAKSKDWEIYKFPRTLKFIKTNESEE